MKNGVVYSEEGYVFEDFYSENRCDGLRIRTGAIWDNGWVYEGGFVNHTQEAAHNG
jgi:hypothetical protein